MPRNPHASSPYSPPRPLATVGAAAGLLLLAFASAAAVTTWHGTGSSELTMMEAARIVRDANSGQDQRAAAALQIRRLCQIGVDALRESSGTLEASRISLLHLGVTK